MGLTGWQLTESLGRLGKFLCFFSKNFTLSFKYGTEIFGALVRLSILGRFVRLDKPSTKSKI